MWRIYPFGEIVLQDDLRDDDTNPQSDRQLKIWLEGTEDDIYKSWQQMSTVEPSSAAEGPLVKAFVDHVHDLAATPRHLYYFYEHDA